MEGTSRGRLADFEILPYAAGDEPAIIECMRACFGVAPHLESWRHVYLENPAGAPTIVTARAGGEVVSHLALLPRRIRAFGKTGIAGHSLDTMTHPQWQRRGLMRALAAESIRQADSRGFVATYGVANALSMVGTVKYEKRTPLGPFPVVVRPLRPLSAAVRVAGDWLRQHARGTPAIAGETTILECAAFGPTADPRGGTWLAQLAAPWSRPQFAAGHSALFDDAAGLPPIALVRDAAHLVWRYPGHATSPYRQRDITTAGKLDATAIIRAARLAGVELVFVMEWHWRHGAVAAARELLTDIIAVASRAGFDGIAALAAPGTPHRRLLRRQGFIPIPEFFFPRTSRLSVRSARSEDRRWDTQDNWYYTWGDGLVL